MASNVNAIIKKVNRENFDEKSLIHTVCFTGNDMQGKQAMIKGKKNSYKIFVSYGLFMFVVLYYN